MMQWFTLLAWGLLGLLLTTAQAQETVIRVQPNQVLHSVSRYLTGACIEDVNHEVYGGIDSQMIFGESFAEPEAQPLLQGFTNYGGRWIVAADGTLDASGGDGPKLICDEPVMGDGEVSVDLNFSGKTNGNAGLILRVSQAGPGADHFNGYEVALEPAGILVLGRHRQDWELLRRVPCDVPNNQWITLRVRLSGRMLQIFVNDKASMEYEDSQHALLNGVVGLRTWQTESRFRNLSVRAGDDFRRVPFVYAEKAGWGGGVSGMWRPLHRGTAEGTFALEERDTFVGKQSQRVTFTTGTGEIGIQNQSLNRWGMNFVKGKLYEGYLWARATSATAFFVSLESSEGTAVYDEKALKLAAGDWQRLNFSLKPNTDDKAGRFAIKFKRPGTVTLGYAFLQPGSWGRFKNLPVRKDVAEALMDQGITVLRLGGSMANAEEYRWKKMIGPRAHRPPYAGWWHPYSSNGWGIFDFLNFCEAAGFLGIPDMNLDETPQDLSDFVEYVNGPPESEWGHKRAQDGHPMPYHLKYLEIGNEEKVNENYWQKFNAIAEAVWAKDSELILVVGDFSYHKSITDPFHFSGADGGITSLATHQKILQLAKEHAREVWFDVHIGTEGPYPDFGGTLTYIDALDKLAEGAKHHVVIFEFNAGNHSQRRALANAAAINVVERDGRLPIALSANCLQPEGQNDNGWNQGLLFLDPSRTWLQPPGYVTRMLSRNYERSLVKCSLEAPGNLLDANATRSEDGKTLVLQIVNPSEQAITAVIDVGSWAPSQPTAQVEELVGPLQAANTAVAPARIKPYAFAWQHRFRSGKTTFTFAPCSFTLIRFE
jgi:hypothetical protein